jgi:type I restriction enzyme S subunit
MISTWNQLPLGELCSFQRGLTYKKSDEVDASSNVVLRANNVDLASNSLNFGELKFIDDRIKIPSSKKVQKGALLICVASGSKSHLGKVAYIDDDYGYAFGGFMGMIVPGIQIESRYLFHFMTSLAYKTFISELSDGTNINNLKFDDLAQFVVPFPPLPEQRRIVAILDEAFAGLEVMRANAEKNLQNAWELLDCILDAVFVRGGSSWPQARLDQICGFQNGFAFKSALFRPTGEPILRISNIQKGTVIDDDLVYFDPAEYRENLDRYKVFPGDLLIAMSGATTGKIGFNDTETIFFLNQRVGKFLPEDRLDSRFLYHFLSTKVEENLRISAGSAQPNLSTEQIRAFAIPFPSVEEQRRIVQEIDRTAFEVNTLATTYQRKLEAINELKQSILQKAYSGELTSSEAVAA